MAPRQAIDFGTVNRLASQHQHQQQNIPQLQQAPYYSEQSIPTTARQSTYPTAHQTNHQTAINTPLLQSVVRPNF